MAKLYRVSLSEQERAALLDLTRKGNGAARKVRRAQILLLADEGETDVAIAGVVHAGVSTVERTRKRLVEEGLEAALVERPRPGGTSKLDAKQQAFVVALACTEPPEGRLRWTMQLLAGRVVELRVVPAISDEAIRRLLKKTRTANSA